MQQQLKTEHLKNLFQAIKNGVAFEEVLELVGNFVQFWVFAHL